MSPATEEEEIENVNRRYSGDSPWLFSAKRLAEIQEQTYSPPVAPDG